MVTDPIGKMDPGEKSAWVAALLSGDYEQAKEVLRCNIGSGKVGYCCWGVYCNLKNPDGWSKSQKLVDPADGRLGYSIGEFGVTELPTPQMISAWSGMTVGTYTVIVELSRCNDGDLPGEDVELRCNGHTFAEIADWIQDNL